MKGLDAWITGNYGDDQYEIEMCPDCDYAMDKCHCLCDENDDDSEYKRYCLCDACAEWREERELEVK